MPHTLLWYFYLLNTAKIHISAFVSVSVSIGRNNRMFLNAECLLFPCTKRRKQRRRHDRHYHQYRQKYWYCFLEFFNHYFFLQKCFIFSLCKLPM